MDDSSLVYAKTHKQEFLEKVIKNKEIVEDKVAVFMAGTPGAGKTEVAEAIAELSSNLCVIDADSFRIQFPGYNGSNSSHFQKGASWLVDHVLTYLLRRGYSFILDGTFAIGKSIQNIQRAIDIEVIKLLSTTYTKIPSLPGNLLRCVRKKKEDKCRKSVLLMPISNHVRM